MIGWWGQLQRQGPGYRGSWMLSKWLCTEFGRHCRITEGFRRESWSLTIILESGFKEQGNANKWLNFILAIRKDPCFLCSFKGSQDFVTVFDINLSRVIPFRWSQSLMTWGAMWALVVFPGELRVPGTSQGPPTSCQVIGYRAAMCAVNEASFLGWKKPMTWVKERPLKIRCLNPEFHYGV